MNTKLSPLAGFILGITHFWASSEKKAINHQISNKTLSGKTRLYGMLVIPLLMLGMITLSYKAQAQTETIHTGSLIVNMGVTNPQTIANGLKPYGMIYDLVRNFKVPVYWIIDPTKAKDGVDFVHNGIQYKGGTFIIASHYLTNLYDGPVTPSPFPAGTTAANRVAYWNTQGVVTNSTTTEFDIDVNYTITSVPRWTLDSQNGAIAQGFLTNAGILNTTFTSGAYNWLLPSQLGACNDLFVMPHADPTWATHSNLYYWNLASRGSIWAGCHAVSVLENLKSTDNTIQMNFLSQGEPNAANAGLVPFGSHSNASIPYTFDPAYASDPVAQYLGATDLAHLNGSEQVFLPKVGGGWRPTTKVLSYDPTPVNAAGTYSGKAAIVAYGQAYGDVNRGYVMYEAGHSINKGTAGDVAAQRAFFNFSLFSTLGKAPVISAITGITCSGTLQTTDGPQTISVSANSPVGGALTYKWSSSCGGSFANPTAQSTTYTPPVITDGIPVECVITVTVTDDCGRVNFHSCPLTILPGPRAPLAVADAGALEGTCALPGTSLVINVLDNDSDPDGDPLTVTGVVGNFPADGTWTTDGTTVTFEPATNFFGSTTAVYTVCDNTPSGPPLNGPKCSTATITASFGTPGAHGCYPGTVYDMSSEVGAVTATQDVATVNNPASAQGLPDFDDTDATTIANTAATIVTNTTGRLKLDFGSVISDATRDTVVVYFGPATAATTTITVEYSTDNIIWTAMTVTGGSSTSSNVANAIGEVLYDFPSGGLRYVRITKTGANALIDAVDLEDWDCIPSVVVANADVLNAREDIAARINVIANDQNPGDLALTITITQNPANGIVSINTDNTLTYLNTIDYSGTDVFKYTICNADGYCSEGTVNVNIADDECLTPGYYAPLTSGPATSATFSTSTQAEDAMLNADKATNKYGANTTVEFGKKLTKSKRLI